MSDKEIKQTCDASHYECLNFNNYCEECKSCPNRVEYIERQLHSQQKTFTLEEIIKEIKDILNAHCYFVASDGAFMLKKDILDLLAEFEQEAK